MSAGAKTPRTPEQQASVIVASLRGRQDGWDWAEHIIASAIKQAEASARNEALEEAEAKFREVACLSDASALCHKADGVAAIRKLKTKD